MRRDKAAPPVRLTVGYSTLPDRISSVRPAPWWNDVDVVVVLQTGGSHSMSAEALLAERDRLEGEGARTAELDSIGVARSRNEVLRMAQTRYVLFCDDDVAVAIDSVQRMVALMSAGGIAVGLGRAEDTNGRLRKNYSRRQEPLTLFNSAKAATYEMVVDVELTRKHGVWFDEEYGAGATNYLGDEYIFIVDALRAGLTAHAIPEVIATHPVESSGSRWGTREDIDARAAVLDRVFGRWSLLGKALFAARHRTRLGGMAGAWRLVRSTPRSRSLRR
ncbi:glycosyltransferase family 2 protein [Demequina aestuarii]|uniref:glycosyltransferase family 2 protein n=1 Tax=Demequina aestuarii TaxID=327095 RepID=UPI000780DAD4|nr:glycosyltransferase [Demequina aestuarii]